MNDAKFKIKPEFKTGILIGLLLTSSVWRENLTGVGKYKTWTPGPWIPSVDRVHGPGS